MSKPHHHPETLVHARAAWAWDLDTHRTRIFSGDHIIAAAVGCVRQHVGMGTPNMPTADLTAEDAAILARRSGAVIDAKGRCVAFPAPGSLRYVCYLNA